MPTPQLIISGSIAVDRIMNFSGRYQELIQPDRINVLSLSVLVDNLHQANGGIGPNIAYAAAALGERPVLLGSAGADANAYMQQLSDAGVDVSYVHTSDLPTATFTAFTDADNNQVAGFYPGAMGDAESLTLAPWKDQDALLCLSAHDPAAMRRQVTECGEYQVRLFYDPGQQVSNVPGEDLAAGIAAAELVAVNEYELSILSEKTGTSVEDLTATIPLLIVTKGAEGSMISGKNMPESVAIPAAKPKQIIDPTGAGDAYRAGFLYGYLRQWDVKQCAQLGSVVASFVLEQNGTQVPLSVPDIINRYQQTYNEEVTL